MVLSSRTFCDSLIMKLKLPNWGSLCNPNLLMNSDYRSGIINQKGQTSYTKGSEDWGKMYSIDMWALQRGVQLNVNDGNISVKCTNSSEPGYLLQKLDYVGKATAAINIQSIIGEVSLETAYGEYELLKKGLNIITYDFGFEQSQGWFSMRISEGATVVIDYMKLEKGSYFTGMPVWNNSEELTKCMACFRILDLSFTGGLSNGTYMPRQRFLFENIMRKIPSVNHVSTQTLYNCTAEIEYVDRFGITLKSIPTNKNDDWAILGYRVELDAYDYD